jgi:hypothetical protein
MGGILILGAFLVAPDARSPQVANAIVSVAPEREYIEPTDADGDGVEDWKKGFPETDGKIPLPEKSAEELARAKESYEEPTTFTGKFAKALFTDYVSTKSLTGTLGNQEDFVQAAIDSIQGGTRSRVYSRLDLTIIPDSPEALHRYGNEMATIFTPETPIKENQIYILERAVKTQNPEELKALEPIKNAQKAILEKARVLPVPKSVADDHADLLTATEAILVDIEAMEGVFTDPLYTLARIKQHQDNVAGLLLVLKSITTTLLANGVSYENEEPGAIIYTIDI